MWENLVTACTKCNSKKGSKSLKQLGWKLKNKPKASDLPVALLDDLEVLYAEKACRMAHLTSSDVLLCCS